MDSCNNKRQRMYESVSNAKSSNDTMCNGNAAGAENQSSDHCPSKFDNPEEGNIAHEDCQQIYRKHTPDISTQRPAGNSMIACACPDIFNFETYRDANQFKVGQIWALYDNFDVMPRFYARIMHFDAHNHKIHLTWLEHEATNEEEEYWTSRKLPIACGSFCSQPTVDTSQDRSMFSHIVAWTKGKKGNSYDIYPKKGEVWALYKGWSKHWSSVTDNHISCEYEVVEVLSNMSADDGATVIPLVKIKDFVSLFGRSKGMSSFFIPSSELLGFSHSIPFYRTNGNEKDGVPRGFLELDTACLPADRDAAFPSVTLVSYMFLGNMTGCVFSDLTTDSADNKMDCGDELIAREENSLEQNVCHSISRDDTDDISSEQNTSEQKKAHDANELGTEDTSTVPNAAESCNLQMLGKRKHDHCVDRGHRRDSCIFNKMPDPVDLNITGRRNLHKQDASTVPSSAGSSGTQSAVKSVHGNICLNMKNNFPSDINMSCKLVFDDGVTNDAIQSDPLHVCSKVDTQKEPKVTDHQIDIKEKATETDSDKDNIMEEAPQTVSEKKPSYSERIILPDPDFFNFQKLRDVNLFEVGQIWALYDNLDGMPRYYARIKHFDASNFKIHLTWLQYVAMDEDEENWNGEELPTACGNFRLGKGTGISEDEEMFSHIAAWTEGKKRKSYAIYPNKGEVWALFKGWSMEWGSDADNHRSYEYEVVEVVSSMSADGGATVIPLVRIEGFVSLFATAKDKSSFVIPSSELLRFSHSIPFYRTKGNEKVGVPRGFLELDNLCLPADLDAAFSCVTLDSYMSLRKQDEGNVTQEGSQQKYKKDGIDIANHMHCNPLITCECSDFFDFGTLREINRIAVNQIWAIYDGHDSKPRNYAQINDVDASNNIVQLTLLEHNTTNLQVTRWTRKELPVACGNFCLGETCVLHDPSMYFSHKVSWVTGKNRNSFEIHPKKGEIWALYKESSFLRSGDTDNLQSVDYDVVEVSDDSMSVGIIVFPLVRIEGFLNLFVESKDKSHILIPSSKLLRFSHSIPCYRTDGSEKVGVGGLLELDTAALPSDLATVFPSITLDSFIDLNKKKITEFVGVTYPDSEFYNFDEDRSCEKFKRGQIWALYSSTDTFPNLYGWINKVEKEPFNVHLTWLKACPQGVDKHWLEQDIPVGCGNFVIRNSTTEHCETCAFSHLVVSRCEMGTMRQVNILPKVGEVWAIYKNWAPDWVPSSNDRPAKYAIGEIKMCTEATILFAFLTKVDGHLSLFKHDVLKGALEVPRKENLRFSHRIPSFRLTKENGGKLCGFYELDPAAVPDVLLWEGPSLNRHF